MFCKNCGTELRENMKFCTGCGSPVAVAVEEPVEAPVEAPVEVPVETPVEEAAPMAWEVAPNLETPAQPEPEPEPSPEPAPAPTPVWEEDPGDGTVYHVPAQEMPIPEPPMEEPPMPKAKKGGKVLPIILAALLVLALAATGFFLWKYLDAEDTIEELEGTRSNLTREVADLESELSSSNNELERVSSQYAELKNRNDILQQDYNLLYNEYSNVTDTYGSLYSEYENILEVYDFFMEFAVICSDDSTNYYHTYFCNDINWNGFWIFNIDYAKSEGWEPCPNCH